MFAAGNADKARLLADHGANRPGLDPQATTAAPGLKIPTPRRRSTIPAARTTRLPNGAPLPTFRTLQGRPAICPFAGLGQKVGGGWTRHIADRLRAAMPRRSTPPPPPVGAVKPCYYRCWPSAAIASAMPMPLAFGGDRRPARGRPRSGEARRIAPEAAILSGL